MTLTLVFDIGLAIIRIIILLLSESVLGYYLPWDHFVDNNLPVPHISRRNTLIKLNSRKLEWNKVKILRGR